MKLFDKYLLACTNQRIPMPSEWQESLGLDITDTKQIALENSVELGGYRFQQDDTLERGYIAKEIKSLSFDTDSRYLMQMYLTALKDHRGTDFTPYFSVGTSTYSFPKYTVSTNIVLGRPYTIFGGTTRPVTVRIYSEASGEELYSEEWGSLSTLEPKVINTSKILNDYISKKEVPGLTLQGDLNGYTAAGEPAGSGLSIRAEGFVYNGGDESSGFLLSVPVDSLVTFNGQGADTYKLHYTDETGAITIQNETPTIVYAGAYLVYPGETVAVAEGDKESVCILDSITVRAIAIDMAETVKYTFNFVPKEDVSFSPESGLSVTRYTAEHILAQMEQYDSKTNAILAGYAVEETASTSLQYFTVALDAGEVTSVRRVLSTAEQTKYLPYYDPKTAIAAEHEYIMLEVVSYDEVTILQGSYMHFPMTRAEYTRPTSSVSIPTKISLNNEHIAFSSSGLSEQISLTVYNQNGRTMSPVLGDDGCYYYGGYPLIYSIVSGSSNVSVSETGLITSLTSSIADAEISITCGNATAYCLISIARELTTTVAGVTIGTIVPATSSIVLINYPGTADDQIATIAFDIVSPLGDSLLLSGNDYSYSLSTVKGSGKVVICRGATISTDLSTNSFEAYVRFSAFSSGTDVVLMYFTDKSTGITYFGRISVTVVNIEDAESISVTSLPNTSTYLVGGTFDSTGLTVTASFSGGITAEVDLSALTVSEVDMSTAGEKEITVTCDCGEHSEELTATFTITVVEVSDAESISITSLPTTLAYVKGSELDTTGLAISATFSTGAVIDLDLSNFAFDVNMDSVGTQTVTVICTCGGHTTELEATFKIIIVEAEEELSTVDVSSISTIYTSSSSPICFTARVGITSSNYTTYYPVLLPEAGFRHLNYSDKLIPALLDAEVTENSTTELQDLVTEGLAGGSLAERIAINTDAIYDVDCFIGNKLVW